MTWLSRHFTLPPLVLIRANGALLLRLHPLISLAVIGGDAPVKLLETIKHRENATATETNLHSPCGYWLWSCLKRRPAIFRR